MVYGFALQFSLMIYLHRLFIYLYVYFECPADREMTLRGDCRVLLLFFGDTGARCVVHAGA